MLTAESREERLTLPRGTLPSLPPFPLAEEEEDDDEDVAFDCRRRGARGGWRAPRATSRRRR